MSYFPLRAYPERLFIPKQAVGANLVYFDLFNAAGSGMSLAISSIRPVVSGAVAVTGILGVDLFLTFTSAIGTTGTAATRTGTSLTAATFGSVSPGAGELNGGITARLTPGGGATAGGVISWLEVFTEETNAATYLDKDFVQNGAYPAEIIVKQGAGIRVVQGAVASVGNIGFNVDFAVIPK